MAKHLLHPFRAALSVCVLALILTGSAFGQLTAEERAGLTGVMGIANVAGSDLGFPKEIFKDSDRLAIVSRSMNEPLKAADELMALHQFSQTASMSSILEKMSGLIYAPSQSTGAVYDQVPESALLQLPEPLRRPVQALANWVKKADTEVKASLEPLTVAERRTLIEGLPVYLAEESKVRFEFVKQSQPSEQTLRALLAKVDVPRILRAAAELAAAVERATPMLRQAASSLQQPLRLDLPGLPTEIYPVGPDIHATTDARLVIDLGGDDLYSGRAGAGVGYASVLLDLGGDDKVSVGDLNIGAGILGIGIAKFGPGNTTFRGGNLCFGVGVAGVGVLAKESGEDFYASGALSEGFGAFGAGLLVDNSGDDTYRATLFAQGASRTRGIGWLVDRRGDDSYWIGGLSMNEPLFTGISYGFGQGFSSGFREDDGGISGGVGLITDFAGNDTYRCETYGQASSYWYALGSLYDASGHDFYMAHHYAQASAMHACSAYLFDLAGDDGYFARVGASQAIGHDYGVAFLLDRAGNDVYAASSSAPSVGSANGLAIFLDSQGNDQYEGPPAQGLASRGWGSVALFADLSGIDKYRDGLKDGDPRLGGTWGGAFDFPSVLPSATPPPTDPILSIKPGSKPYPGDSAIEVLYRKATQWGVGSAQQDVQNSLKELVAIGMPAFQWMLDQKVDRANRLELRAFSAMVRYVGVPAREALGIKLLKSDDLAARRILSIATEAQVKEVAPVLPGLMLKPDLRRQAIQASGSLGGEECVSTLLPLCADSDPIIASMAAVALSQIGSETAYSTAESMLGSTLFVQRKASITLLAKFPNKALATAGRAIQTFDEITVKAALELLALLKSREAAALAATKLADRSPSIRLQALVACAGRCPDEMKQFFLNLRRDSDPAVRAMANKLEP
ncbi:MAG: HEAT repeat domain-containing protein [Armatimonadetes bacterium]|nr:HEAT repeat domain-containing protein [Armatimonadota bacterium]